MSLCVSLHIIQSRTVAKKRFLWRHAASESHVTPFLTPVKHYSLTIGPQKQYHRVLPVDPGSYFKNTNRYTGRKGQLLQTVLTQTKRVLSPPVLGTNLLGNEEFSYLL